MVMALADALHTLLRLPGATYACVVERDSGRVLAELGQGEASTGDSEGVVAYSVPRWGTAVAAMFGATSGDELDDVMITGRRSYHLVRPLGPVRRYWCTCGSTAAGRTWPRPGGNWPPSGSPAAPEPPIRRSPRRRPLPRGPATTPPLPSPAARRRDVPGRRPGYPRRSRHPRRRRGGCAAPQPSPPAAGPSTVRTSRRHRDARVRRPGGVRRGLAAPPPAPAPPVRGRAGPRRADAGPDATSRTARRRCRRCRPPCPPERGGRRGDASDPAPAEGARPPGGGRRSVAPAGDPPGSGPHGRRARARGVRHARGPRPALGPGPGHAPSPSRGSPQDDLTQLLHSVVVRLG